MSLRKTVSEILGHEVTEEGAREFASRQFGALSSYLKKDLKEENKLLRANLKKVLVSGAR